VFLYKHAGDRTQSLLRKCEGFDLDLGDEDHLFRSVLLAMLEHLRPVCRLIIVNAGG
jgi:hypothetical protein